MSAFSDVSVGVQVGNYRAGTLPGRGDDYIPYIQGQPQKASDSCGDRTVPLVSRNQRKNKIAPGRIHRDEWHCSTPCQTIFAKCNKAGAVPETAYGCRFFCCQSALASRRLLRFLPISAQYTVGEYFDLELTRNRDTVFPFRN